jgi:predicted secreted protein
MKVLLLIIAVFAHLAVSAPLAVAADASDRAIIGFSMDGGHFAFEEYGVQDGSGFPYSNIYIINLKTDEWVKGSPIRVLVRDENATAHTARHQALTEAAPLIEKYGTVQPIKLLASNAVGERVTSPHKMTFKRFHNLSTLWTVQLTELDIEQPGECKPFSPVRGFALSARIEGQDKTVELYRDEKLPKSRGCPEGYKLADVIAFGENEDAPVVVLVHKLTFGFEGRDARFIAVPVELPSWR